MTVNTLTLYMPGSSVGIQVYEGSQLHLILVSQGANSVPSAPGQTVRADPFPQYVHDDEIGDLLADAAIPATDPVVAALVTNTDSATSGALRVAFVGRGELVVDPAAYGAVGDYGTDDTVALQAAIDAAGALAANGGLRCLVALRFGKRYTVSGLTFPSFTGLTGGGALFYKAGSTTHLLQLADPSSTTNVTIENINIIGQNTAQTQPLDGIHFDNAASPASIMCWHKIRNVHIYATSGVGCYLGTYTRGTLVDGLTTYKTDQQGLVLGGADSRVSNCDIGQAGVSGVLISGTGYQLTNVKSWYSGRLDNVGSGFDIAGASHTLVNCWAQDNMGNGFNVFRAGVTITGLTMAGCVSDNDNAALAGYSGFNLFNVRNAIIQGMVRTYSGGRNGIPASGLAMTGPNGTGNEISLSVTGTSSWPVTAGSLLASNTVTVNGRKNRVNAFPYAGTLSANPWDAETFTMTLTGAVTVANPGVTPSGLELLFIFTQDATGGRVITWGSNFKVINWTPNTAAGKINSIRFRSDGTSWIQTGGTIAA